MKSLDTIALILVIVGALNWGLWGVFQFDLVAALLGGEYSSFKSHRLRSGGISWDL